MGRHSKHDGSTGRVRRPAEPEDKAAWTLRLIGDHDVATGQTTGLVAQCAEDPTWLQLMRDVRDRAAEAYLIATTLATRATKEGGQYSLGDIERMLGIRRQSIHENARKGQDLLDTEREKLGVAVLRRRRHERLTAAGLADVVPLPDRREATG